MQPSIFNANMTCYAFNLTIVETTTNHELIEARCFSSWRSVDSVDMKRLNQGPDWDIGPLVHLHIALCVFKGTSPASDMPRYFSIWPEVPSQAVLFSDLRLFLRGVSRLWIQGMGQELQYYGTLWNQLVGGWRSTTTSSLLLGHHGLDPYTDWWLILTRRLDFFLRMMCFWNCWNCCPRIGLTSKIRRETPIFECLPSSEEDEALKPLVNPQWTTDAASGLMELHIYVKA